MPTLPGWRTPAPGTPSATTAWIKQAERRNQRSVALDYFSEDGKQVLLRLLADTDVFIESSKGGTWRRRG